MAKQYLKPKKKAEKGNTYIWNALLRIVDGVMMAISCLVTLLLIMAMLARYIPPTGLGWIFAFAGLVFPIFFVCEAIVMLYWVVRWKWIALILAAFILFCLPDARLFYKPDLGKHYASKIPVKEGIVVMNYNVMGFNYDGGAIKKNQATASKIAAAINRQDVDILCVQEFLMKEGITDTHFNEGISNLKYHYEVSYSNPKASSGLGIAVYSRYPIIAKGIVDTGGDLIRSIWCDIRIGYDTVRVFSNHLQNTNITDSDEDYVAQSMFVDKSIQLNRLKSIVVRLRDSYRLRAPQADSIAVQLRNSPYSVIVCGDFNDTPLSYSYHRIVRGLKDSYVAEGHGAMGTYHGFFNMFHIDHILYSPSLRSIRFEALDITLSDHSPIITEFVIDD